MAIKHLHTAVANEIVRKEYWNDNHTDPDWSDLTNKPASAVADIDEAVTKKHTQGTDTTLGAMTTAINMNTHLINNVTDPVDNQDAATKKYVLDNVGVSVGMVPIGGVVAWLKNYTNTPALPAQFVECNGQVLSDAGSVYNGQTIPNLNGGYRFLQGNSTSGTTGGGQKGYLNQDAGVVGFLQGPVVASRLLSGDSSLYTPTGGAAATYYPVNNYIPDMRPPYYAVVWIMRIK